MTKAALQAQGHTAPAGAFPSPAPLPADFDILDWDVTIETPPPRPSETLRVTLEHAGWSRPIAVSDPRSDS